MYFHLVSNIRARYLITLTFAFFLQTTPALASTAGPVKPVDDVQPMALITAIVVGDQLKTEAAVTEVAVKRAATPTVAEPAKINQPLFLNDKLETFAGASVKVVFLNTDIEKRNEVSISENSQVIIGSVTCPWVCKWFADLKDTFRGKTRKVSLDNQGTKYEVEVTKEGEIVRVYEGTVFVKKLEEPPKTDAPANVPGQPVSLKISYRSGEELISREAPADDVIAVVPFLYQLRLPDNVVSTPPAVPEKLEEADVRKSLEWSSKLEIAAHPSKRTDENGIIIRETEFSDEERDKQFLEARFQSIWNKQPDSFVTLARIYKDWGEGTKTLANIDEARRLHLAQDRNWTDSEQMLYTEARAYEMIGKFDLSRKKVEEAVVKFPSSTAKAETILATIQYREGDMALKRKDYTLAKQRFGQAAISFDKLADSNADIKSIALANYGQAVRGLGNIAQEEKKYEVALKRYEFARMKYQESYRIQESAFSEKAVADIYRDQSRIYYAMGAEAAGDKKFQLSEMTYLKTVENNKDFGEAYCGLVSLYVLTDRNDKVNEYLKSCLAGNPAGLTNFTEVPNAEGRTKASAVVNFLQVGIVPKFTGEGKFVDEQSIEAGKKVRRGTEVLIKLGPPPGPGIVPKP